MKRPAVILLAEADNILVACRNIEAGEMVPIDGVYQTSASSVSVRTARRWP